MILIYLLLCIVDLFIAILPIIGLVLLVKLIWNPNQNYQKLSKASKRGHHLYH